MEAALCINSWAAVSPPPEYTLEESLDYALACEGSGVRERLTRELSRANGLLVVDASLLADSVESFHCASLILDDLPCMDDATERRGRACLHLVAGEDQAMLAALALINRAYTGFWKVAARYPQKSALAAKLVGRCMGESGILYGQSRDLAFQAGLGEREVRTIAEHKTGMLLQLALMLPALLGGADWRSLLRLARLAKGWGRLYQGIDDFSDMLMTGESTGKTPYRDLRQERPNLVVALGPERALAELRNLEVSSIRICRSFQGRGSAWRILEDFHARLGDKVARIQGALEAA
ncbi:MAG: polyprenyl synthetase family protein [Opitutales bacterium]